MAHLEVGDFGLVAGFDQGFKTVLDELRHPAAQYVLFTEQVGFRFFGEGRLDNARAGSADAFRVGLCQFPSASGCVAFHGDNIWHTLTGNESTAHHVPRALGSHHAHIVAGTGLDVAETDVEPMSKEQGGVRLQVRLDFGGIDLALHLVRQQNHDHVCFFHGIRHGFHRQALFLGLSPGGGAFAQAHDHVDPRIAQVQRVGMTLRAVTNYGHLLRLNERQVSVVFVINFRHDFSP